MKVFEVSLSPVVSHEIDNVFIGFPGFGVDYLKPVPLNCTPTPTLEALNLSMHVKMVEGLVA